MSLPFFKSQMLAVLAVAAIVPSAHSQLLLNTGDTYTYEFASLPTTVVPVFGITGIEWIPSFSDFGSGDVIRIEAFENSVGETPWASFNYGQLPGNRSVGSSINWIGDFQGVVRVSVISGSAVLDSMHIQGQRPIGGGSMEKVDVLVTPVPEPGTWSLLGVAGMAALAWRVRRK